MDTGAIITIVIGLVISIIGFFLKRTINDVDRLDECKASKNEMIALVKRVDDQSKTIGDIKTNYLTKDDYFREQARVDRKLDDIMKVLLKLSEGGGKHE